MTSFHFDHAKPGSISNRRTGHPRKDHAGDHIDLAQSAPDMPHQHPGKAKDALGDPAGVHQVAG